MSVVAQLIRLSGGASRAIVAGVIGIAAAGAAAQGPTAMTTVRVASGLISPVWAAAPKGDTHRLFIVEQVVDGTARVRLLDLRTNTLQAEPFLSIPGISPGGESGMFGLAFHPDYASNGYFWVYYTASDARRVARYRAIGDPLTATAADPASAELVLAVHGTITEHIAGWIDFSPDGFLYIAIGDGGTGARAQAITDQLMGKILRIDVDGADNIPGNADDDGFPGDTDRLFTVPATNPFVGVAGDDEIWAYGLRNPFRNDIDPATGDVYIADVGGGLFEEVNLQPFGDPGAMPGEAGYFGGRNYGWICYEGTAPRTLNGCAEASTMTFPHFQYGHSQVVPPINATGCAVMGGVVYRGCAIPDLEGVYLFADLCTHRIFGVRSDGTEVTEVEELTAEMQPLDGSAGPSFIVSFARDGRGEAYIISEGNVFKVVRAVPNDLNGDGIADTCICPAEWNGDGSVNSSDISSFLTAWLAAVTDGTLGADYDRSGATNSSDISAFLGSWLAALDGGC